MRLSSSILAFSFALVAIATPLKRDATTVESDIASISSQVSTLDAAITAFPSTGGSLVNALAIHTDATNLDTTVKSATTDTTGSAAFTETEGNTILTAIQALQPLITTTLSDIVAKKPAFDGLPIGGISALVLQDLKSLSTDTAAFETALIAKAPADLQAQSQTVSDTINAAFTSAIAAYS
ncbi:hydrophobic surface binding protein [Amylostereum chailletii]|nr:hydrophobic surface binding protein [Amylostereum chailletii]